METRSQALKGVFATWKARLLVGLPVGAGIYQFGCDQFDWPKLPALWGMTGQLIPWWGWLVVAQAGFVFALFEYVRRNVGPSQEVAPRDPDETDLREELAKLESLLQISLTGVVPDLKRETETVARKVQENYEFLQPAVAMQGGKLGQVETQLAQTTQAFAAKFEDLTKRLAYLENERRFDEAMAVKDALDLRKIPKPEPTESGLIPRREWSDVGANMQIRSAVFGLGISETDYRRALDAARDGILSSSLFCRLEGGENKIWENVIEKQGWYIYNAQLDALADLVRKTAWRFRA